MHLASTLFLASFCFLSANDADFPLLRLFANLQHLIREDLVPFCSNYSRVRHFIFGTPCYAKVFLYTTIDPTSIAFSSPPIPAPGFPTHSMTLLQSNLGVPPMIPDPLVTGTLAPPPGPVRQIFVFWPRHCGRPDMGTLPPSAGFQFLFVGPTFSCESLFIYILSPSEVLNFDHNNQSPDALNKKPKSKIPIPLVLSLLLRFHTPIPPISLGPNHTFYTINWHVIPLSAISQ